MASIFVQIPAYHDLELIKTIDSLYSQASGDNTINVGIHFNYYENLPEEIEIFLNKKKYNIKSIIKKAPDGLGMQKARYSVNNFYNGENYYFQTDSHMVFKKNWDSILIEDYNHLKNLYKSKIVISSYCHGYSYDSSEVRLFDDGKWSSKMPNRSQMQQDELNLNEINSIGQRTNLKFKPKKNNCKYINSTDNIHNLVSGHFIFCTGELSTIYRKEGPNLSAGEEALLSMKLVSNGFNIVGQLRETAKHLFPHPYLSSENGKNSVNNKKYQDMLKEYPRRIARIDFAELDVNAFDWDLVHDELLGVSQTQNILFNNMSFQDYTEICWLEFEKIV